MRIKLIPENTLNSLKDGIEGNLGRYRRGDRHTFEDAIDTGLEADLPALEMDAGSDGKSDTNNVQTVFEAFRSLPISIIRDERFWAHLTHVEFLEYTQSRWPLDSDDDKAKKQIVTRYFASTDRSIENRNAMSRLYWIGYVANRYPGDLRETIEMITFRQDVILNFIERPGVLQIPSVFDALVSRMLDSYRTDKALFERAAFRDILKQLNLACGSGFVESLPAGRIADIVDGAIEKALPDPEQATAPSM